jgi:hypothetical protein
MDIAEKTPSESQRENAAERARIANDVLTRLKKLFELEAAGWSRESTPNSHSVSRNLKTFADRCAQALNDAIAVGLGGEASKRDATAVVFGIKTDLNREATGWESVASGYPVVQLYKGLADNCDKEWYDAIARERGEKSENPIPHEDDFFGNPPEQRHSGLFEEVKALVNGHFKETGSLPDLKELWDSLVSKYEPSYNSETKAIKDLSRTPGGLKRTGLRKLLKAWKYKPVV